MKKLFFFFFSLLPVFAALTSALAEESALRLFFDNLTEVLLDIDNGTVSGTAEFSLDGEWFKSVDTVYKQCGYRSSWKLDLLSPLPDGEKKASGWTILADEEKRQKDIDSLREEINVLEEQLAVLSPSSSAESLWNRAQKTIDTHV